MSTDAARPRTPRDGSHLTLVVGGIPPTPNDDKKPEKPAPPLRRVPPLGSATARALIGLSALLSALGFSIGKAEAELRSQDQIEEADPTVHTPEVAADDAVPDTTAGVTAAHWAPVKRTVVAAYKVPGPTGRHRKPASTDGWGEWNPDTWEQPVGRHRKPTPPKTAHVPVGAHQHAHPPAGAVKLPKPSAVKLPPPAAKLVATLI